MSKSKIKADIRKLHELREKFNLPEDIFHEYREYIKNLKYGKYTTERCKVGKKTAHKNHMTIHHIVPKVFGGRNCPSNKCALTAEEHRYAHVLFSHCIRNYPELIKMHGYWKPKAKDVVKKWELSGKLKSSNLLCCSLQT